MEIETYSMGDHLTIINNTIEIGMDYEEWIGRERRIRSTLLMSSPEIQNKRICRVCQDCGEVCLCHELTCPHCGSIEIVDQQFNDVEKEVLSRSRIRCRLRFKNIYKIVEQQDSHDIE